MQSPRPASSPGAHQAGSLAKPGPTDADIHHQIFQAILARRLQPGGRLVEDELARLFGVSRTKIRAALIRLAENGIVEIRRNQGATVAAPTRAAIRQVLECRCLVEPAIAAALADRPSSLDLTEITDHVGAEELARTLRDEPTLVQLTGEFHLKLAALHGNALLIRLLHDAEALMVLGILSYGRPNAAACLPGEHRAILDAISAGQPDRAAREMKAHLRHIAAEMDLDDRPAPPKKLTKALSEILTSHKDWSA